MHLNITTRILNLSIKTCQCVGNSKFLKNVKQKNEKAIINNIILINII